MIQFTPLRTKRLTVNMRELSIDDAEALCMLPVQYEQAGTTAMLERIVETLDRALPGQEIDPLLWTVQERTFVMAHYMTHTTTDGSPNFRVGDGSFSDYMISGTDYVEEISLGLIDGDEILMRPLLGYQAEAIERLVLGGRVKKNRLSWWVGAMACQIRKSTDEPMGRLSDSENGEWLLARMEAFRSLPESEFAQVLFAFLDGTERLAHFFQLVFGDEGISVSPKDKEVKGLYPARFPIRSLISQPTLRILGIPDQPEG